MADDDKTEQTKRRIRCALDKLESATASESERAASSRRKGKSIEQLEDESRIIRNL